MVVSAAWGLPFESKRGWVSTIYNNYAHKANGVVSLAPANIKFTNSNTAAYLLTQRENL